MGDNQPSLFNRPLLCSMFSGSKMARFTLLAVLLVSLLLTMSPATLAKENAHDHMTFISFMELFEPMDGKPGSLLHLGDAVIEIPVGSLKAKLEAEEEEERQRERQRKEAERKRKVQQ